MLPEEGEEDFGTRLSGLVQSALIAQNVDIRCAQAPTTTLDTSDHTFTSPTLPTHLASQLPQIATASLPTSTKSQSIVVETMEVRQFFW